MGELGDLLELGHGARIRRRTVRVPLGNWRHNERARAAPGWQPAHAAVEGDSPMPRRVLVERDGTPVRAPGSPPPAVDR